MDDKNKSNNNGNASNKKNRNRNSSEEGPSEEPPVKKRKTDFDIQIIAMCTKHLIELGRNGDSNAVLPWSTNVTICDDNGWNIMHNASAKNWLDVVKIIVNDWYCRYLLINSLTLRKESPLVLAAKNSQKNIVIYLLNSGANFEIGDKYGMTLLHHASEKGWMDIVQYIVRKGFGINALTSKRETALIVAAKRSQKEIVKLLLSLGANLNCQDAFGRSALYYASSRSAWLDVVQSFVEKGVDLDAKNLNYETALVNAAQLSNEEIVSFLIGVGANCSYCDREGWGILHFAAQNGWLKTVLTVANNGVDVNAKTIESETALLLAAKFSYKEIVKALIGLGANVHCCDSKGWSLLHYASKNGWLDVVASVANKDADIDSKTDMSETPILLAAKNSYLDIVKYFIYLGVKFNCNDIYGRNMLNYSSKNGWMDIVEYAVERGMDPNAETTTHITALRYAIRHKKQDVASFLISVGANFHFCDKNGWTILHYAAARGWCDVAQHVLKEVDINAKSSKSATALLIAAIYSRKKIVTLLIDTGADIHCTDRFNNTILHHAAKKGWLDVVKSAVEKGVYVDSLCVNNDTALLLAARYSHPNVACLLSNFGANVNLFDRYGKTVLHYASERGWVDVVESVIKNKNGADLNVMYNTEDTPLHLACIHEEIGVLKCLLEAGADYSKKAPGPRHFTPLSYAIKKSCILDTSAMVEAVALFIENGAFPELDDCDFISQSPLLKEGILRNKKLCAQAFINKFNNEELPKLYTLFFANRFPPIDHVKIGKNQKVVEEIEDRVQRKMDTNSGYCDLIDIYYEHPYLLSVLSVRALLVAHHRLTYVC